MEWECERHDWASLRTAEGSAEPVPVAIQRLCRASDAEEITRAYWSIDNVVVVQGALTEAAPGAAACLAVALVACPGAPRAEIIELLVQLGNGQEVHAPPGTLLRIRAELRGTAAAVFEILEHGTREERIGAVDLLVILAEHDASLRDRALWYARRLGSEPSYADLGDQAVRWLEDLARPSS